MYPISSPHSGQNTHKKTNMHSYKTNSQHTTPKLEPQVGLLNKEKKKQICGSIIYLPTLLFVLLHFIFKLAFPFTSLSSFGNKSDHTPCSSPKLLQQLWQQNKPLTSKPTFCPLPSLSKLRTFFFSLKITLDCPSCCHSMIKKKMWRWWTNYLLLNSSYY
jgi:hypothetical protein